MPEVVWLAEYRRFKDDLMQSVAAAAGQGRRLWTIPLRWRDWPETAARVEHCLARAKRQPRGPLGRALKRTLLRLQYNGARAWFAVRPGRLALCWNGLTGSRRAFMLGAADAGAARLFAELAPFAGRMTLDPMGVNAEGSPRPGAWDATRPDPALLDGLRTGMTARAPRRADVGQVAREIDGPFLFVPLQVPDDSQIRLFSGWTRDLPGFLDALRQAAGALPPGWHLRVKEHPSARQSLAALVAGDRLVLDNQTDSLSLLAQSRGVVTVNSSMGLQAMFWGKPVIVTGRAFWALPGLAHPAGSAAEMTALFSAAATLESDADQRARFLTWLARDYLIPVADGRADPAAVRARIAQATRCSA
jgi:capsular polysaccharide export protein